VARIIREQYPELELHASTQMAVHNKEGALALQKMGFSRVVIARELSLREIKEISPYVLKTEVKESIKLHFIEIVKWCYHKLRNLRCKNE